MKKIQIYLPEDLIINLIVILMLVLSFDTKAQENLSLNLDCDIL
jgi:hypothetical protein